MMDYYNVANIRIKTYALDNSTRVKTFHLGIRVKLIETRNTEGKVNVSKEFYGLGFLHSHKEDINVFLDCPFLQEC